MNKTPGIGLGFRAFHFAMKLCESGEVTLKPYEAVAVEIM